MHSDMFTEIQLMLLPIEKNQQDDKVMFVYLFIRFPPYFIDYCCRISKQKHFLYFLKLSLFLKPGTLNKLATVIIRTVVSY